MRATILALIVVFGMGVGLAEAKTPPPVPWHPPIEWFNAIRRCHQIAADPLMCRPCEFPFEHCIPVHK